MKRILLVSLLALACVLPAQAGYDVVPLTVPTVAADATSNSIAQVIACVGQQNVAISWSTGSTNWVARLSASVDASRWQTNYYVFGGDSSVLVTNLNVKGVGFLRLDSVLSTGTIAATNTVSWGRKTESP